MTLTKRKYLFQSLRSSISPKRGDTWRFELTCSSCLSSQNKISGLMDYLSPTNCPSKTTFSAPTSRNSPVKTFKAWQIKSKQQTSSSKAQKQKLLSQVQLKSKVYTPISPAWGINTPKWPPSSARMSILLRLANSSQNLVLTDTKKKFSWRPRTISWPWLLEGLDRNEKLLLKYKTTIFQGDSPKTLSNPKINMKWLTNTLPRIDWMK